VREEKGKGNPVTPLDSLRVESESGALCNSYFHERNVRSPGLLVDPLLSQGLSFHSLAERRKDP
jgi:hypothetical protein